ncbi:MAG: sporulation protein YabP [Clostridiales bacterium]|nr:sporulation protein YabP [Clostridiales bacterium]
MNMDEKKARFEHRLTLEGREALSVTGVEDVVSFDEGEILLYTVEGTLCLRGNELHIQRLSIENGELQIEGVIDSMEYTDNLPRRQGFLSRLFG